MKHSYPNNPAAFLPTSKKEVTARGWEQLDVILFTGDAYIDHPAFGAAVIGRVLEAEGLKVAIVPQPNWRDDLRDFSKLGTPRLFFGVTSGSMDSMVNHYTANKRLRSNDAYTPDGKAGYRPDYAVVTYSKILKQLFPETPVVLGGIEASLRRLTHYDYWSDSLKPSILVESGADILVYGMGEKPIREIARRLSNHQALQGIPQTAMIVSPAELADERKHHCEDGASHIPNLSPATRHSSLITVIARRPQAEEANSSLTLPSFEACKTDKKVFAEHFRLIEREANSSAARIIIEPVNNGTGGRNASYRNGASRIPNPSPVTHHRHCEEATGRGSKLITVFPPYPPMTETEIDASFDLPYTRLPHPRYKDKHIPAYEMIKHSVNIHRGCFGGCSFCTIAAHQGKDIISRSETSILREIDHITALPDFKGYLSDLGGPSANMYGMKGKDGELCAKCHRTSCIHPSICKNLNTDHSRLLALYRQAEQHPAIKKAFVGSGVRYDLLLNEKGFFNKTAEDYFSCLMEQHVSGRLKVAPEHTEEHVLKTMRKPSFTLFERLKIVFDQINRKLGTRLQLIPYFISSHPDCKESDMQQLSKKLRYLHMQPEQVQDFTPTPMTLSSAMFYTGIHPETGEKIYVARGKEEKLRQKDWFFTKI